MVRILFVCLGNICRSPLAEAVFNHQISQKGLEHNFLADSCGTADYHVDDPPDPRTIRNARKNGVPIDHVGRQFEFLDFKRFDLILPMDESNEADLLRFPGAEKFREKIKLMRTFDSENEGADVPDPYSGGEEDFQEVFEILDRSVKGLIKFLETDVVQ